MSAMLSRVILENQIYFVTTKTFGNRRIFVDDETYRLLVETMKLCKVKYRFKLFGYVILPDHVHLLIQSAEHFTISQVMQKIKGLFAHQFKRTLRNRVAASLARGDRSDSKTVAYADKMIDLIDEGQPVWQKSFYDHAIRNEKDFIEKLNYIHKNPLKHNITTDLDNYLWSSYQNYYADNNGLITINKLLL